MNSRPSVLVIAGSDSSGGAGLLRDVQVMAQFEVDTRCAVTAVTAQTNSYVAAIHHPTPQIVRQQIQAALAAGGIGAVKIGMLGTRAIVEAVIETLPPRERIPIVLDPVLASSSGGSLLEAAALPILRESLMPRVTLTTPNVMEAAVLLGEAAAMDEAAMIEHAQRILQIGPQAVLLKGGHAAGEEAVDVLVTATGAPMSFHAPRINASLRGTGCALSSAIAASLARGMSLNDACDCAKRFVFRQLQRGYAGHRLY
jgi:hydroxymethylpyrimidine/phosphomethylpyrimidine kinase